MKYSNSFGKKSSKILLGTGYFGDTISEAESFAIMDTYYEMGADILFPTDILGDLVK